MRIKFDAADSQLVLAVRFPRYPIPKWGIWHSWKSSVKIEEGTKRVPSMRVSRFLPYSITVRSLHWPGLSSVRPPSSVLHFSTPGMVGRVLICFVVAARPLCEWHWHLSRCFAVDKIKSKPAIAGIVRSVWMCVCLCLSHSLSVCVTQRGPFAADFFTNGVTNFKQVISACCLWASICARATGETDNERERVSEREIFKEVHNEIYVQYREKDRERERDTGRAEEFIVGR